MRDKPVFRMEKYEIEIGNAGFLYILFAVVYLIAHIIALPAIIANMLIAIVGLLCLVYTATKVDISRLIVLGLIASVLMALSMVVNGNADVYDLLWIWSYMGVGALLYYFEINPRLLSLVGYGSLLLFLAMALVGINAAHVLMIGSQNNISAYVTFFMAVIFLSQRESCKSLSYFPALGIVLVSIWSSSRAGILTGIVCLALVVFNNVFLEKKNKLKSTVTCVVLFIIAVFFVSRYFGSYIGDLTAKFNRYGTGSVRTEIWKEYLHGAAHSLRYLFFGVSCSNLDFPHLAFYNGNTHNAFLMLHAKFGLLGFVYIIIITGTGLLKALRKKEFPIVVAMLTVIARSMFDWTGFPGLFDAVFWYMILYVQHSSTVPQKTVDANITTAV